MPAYRALRDIVGRWRSRCRRCCRGGKRGTATLLVPSCIAHSRPPVAALAKIVGVAGHLWPSAHQPTDLLHPGHVSTRRRPRSPAQSPPSAAPRWRRGPPGRRGRTPAGRETVGRSWCSTRTAEELIAGSADGLRSRLRSANYRRHREPTTLIDRAGDQKWSRASSADAPHRTPARAEIGTPCGGCANLWACSWRWPATRRPSAPAPTRPAQPSKSALECLKKATNRGPSTPSCRQLAPAR